MKMKKTIFASNLMMASILIILGSLTVATSAVASNLTIHVKTCAQKRVVFYLRSAMIPLAKNIWIHKRILF
jgi:hypothetical protein